MLYGNNPLSYLKNALLYLNNSMHKKGKFVI